METVLVINPGSTSTKLALFANHDCLAEGFCCKVLNLLSNKVE
ncbi:hypothetical protein EfaecalisJ6_08500 [Enterococcus faecalis]|nr:hypothetical protein EfaecalisJ5_19480 [Enterococcus faecalis]GEJ74032.1 hypothetical protein EfaecalisJ6_08500 [Enterococcus faecalis]GEJ76755.1 hypothetical protein EfaecalisJ7_08500 [Enterococcus faecalis]GEJ80743.1 hypothetical protein EfaecalisJ8_21150 [Enterococcus faecalis]GEJ82166.1 hypothetical protein EfaecalisJ9_08190 [Enterococcus faecalis]